MWGSTWRCTTICSQTAVDDRIPVNPVASILIIRPSAIGDVVMASPMIKVLREAYPEARLVWLAEPQVRDLLCANPQLDEVIIWPKEKWRELLKRGRLLALVREIRKLAAALRREKFDLALDVQGLLRSRLLAWLSGARERVGFESREPGRFLLTRVVSRGSGDKRMSSEYSNLMEALDLSPGDFRPEIALSEPNREEAGRILRGRRDRRKIRRHLPLHHSAAETLVRGALGGSGPGNRNPVRPSRGCAGRARRRRGQPAHSIPGRGKVHALAGKSTLGQSAALIASCALLIGVDTGLTHMGTAFSRPTVGPVRRHLPLSDHGQPPNPCALRPAVLFPLSAQPDLRGGIPLHEGDYRGPGPRCRRRLLSGGNRNHEGSAYRNRQAPLWGSASGAVPAGRPGGARGRKHPGLSPGERNRRRSKTVCRGGGGPDGGGSRSEIFFPFIQPHPAAIAPISSMSTAAAARISGVLLQLDCMG